MVAGEGFEPPTQGLWFLRSTDWANPPSNSLFLIIFIFVFVNKYFWRGWKKIKFIHKKYFSLLSRFLSLDSDMSVDILRLGRQKPFIKEVAFRWATNKLNVEICSFYGRMSANKVLAK